MLRLVTYLMVYCRLSQIPFFFFFLNSRTRSLWFLRGTLGGVTQENGPLLLAFIPVDSSLRGMSTHGPEPNPLHFLLTQYLENNYMQL